MTWETLFRKILYNRNSATRKFSLRDLNTMFILIFPGNYQELWEKRSDLLSDLNKFYKIKTLVCLIKIYINASVTIY